MWDPQDHGEWFKQRPSFRQSVPPPSTQACDAPLVCFSINQSWLPYIVGALMQLAQPSTWLVSSESERDDVLARAQDVIAEIGTAMPCTSTPIAPVGTTTAQGACNIAGYIANMVIKTSLQQALDSINSNTTVIQYGIIVLSLIPGSGLVVPALANALYGLYAGISGGTQSDFTDALVDETLWSAVTCAIYAAISTDGYVTDVNFPTVQSNVCAISYTHPDVITAICNYLTTLGVAGLESLQQAGALAVYDCSGCPGGSVSGPSSLPITQATGVVSITITAGNASATATVTFTNPFGAAPEGFANAANTTVIASVTATTTTTLTIEVEAAVSVATDLVVQVWWLAILGGEG